MASVFSMGNETVVKWLGLREEVASVESVVTLTVDDAGELLTLQRAAFVAEARAHGDLNLPPLTQSLDELKSELSKAEVTAIGLRSDTDRLVAAVCVLVPSVDSRTAELGRLVVAPDLQGQGLGSRLLKLIENCLPEQLTELRLFTGEHSAGNLRLYARFGYRETHRTATPGGYASVHLSKRMRGA